MPSTTVQFFATPEELCELAERWHAKVGGWAALMEFFPEFVLVVRGPQKPLVESCDQLANVRRICFTAERPHAHYESPYDFVTKHPDCLVLDLGARTEKALNESALGFKTNDPAALSRWKAIAKDLKSQTSAGLWVTSTKASQSAFSKNLRFTDAAAVLSRAGTRLQPLGPALVASVDEPKER
jgi:hypothetical protein